MRTPKELADALERLEILLVAYSVDINEGQLPEDDVELRKATSFIARGAIEWSLGRVTDRSETFAELISLDWFKPDSIERLRELRQEAIQEGCLT